MHYSLATEKVYLYWVRFFVCWSGHNGPMEHPRDIDAKGVEAFLTKLATGRHVSAVDPQPGLDRDTFSLPEVLTINLPMLDRAI